MFEYVISVFNYFVFCLCFPWNWKSSSVFFAAQGFDIWDRDKWWHLDSNFKQIWRFLHLKYKLFCTIFVLKCLYDSLLGSDHLIHGEIAMLKDRRMGCKERDAYFSLRCYICTLSLALSFLTSFPFIYPPRQQQCDVLWELCTGARLTAVETTEAEKSVDLAFLLPEARMTQLQQGWGESKFKKKKKSH